MLIICHKSWNLQGSVEISDMARKSKVWCWTFQILRDQKGWVGRVGQIILDSPRDLRQWWEAYIKFTTSFWYHYFILQEELVLVKRKVERLRKIEMASDMDEILKEEIREYKETLTCPSCKVKRKDAVLTKCFHCFCYDCLRTRYETRQRKCPKCNAAFGASDYHRLYLAWFFCIRFQSNLVSTYFRTITTTTSKKATT